MLRLTTTGRRSGQRRLTMVGYYEDGKNLVTLATNGWADAEPAWWLNLQAQPDTTVHLPDGPRTVHAHAATGAERERLWAKFREYPGWGDDIDALAARRSIETAVVVRERQLFEMAHAYRAVSALRSAYERQLVLTVTAAIAYGGRILRMDRLPMPAGAAGVVPRSRRCPRARTLAGSSYPPRIALLPRSVGEVWESRRLAPPLRSTRLSHIRTPRAPSVS